MVHEAYASQTPVSPEVLGSFLLILLIQITCYSSTWTSAVASSSENKNTPSFPSSWSLPFNSACMLPLGQDVGKVIVGTGASSRVLLVPGSKEIPCGEAMPLSRKGKTHSCTVREMVDDICKAGEWLGGAQETRLSMGGEDWPADVAVCCHCGKLPSDVMRED